MTLLFFLKPSYGMPPSGIPLENLPKKERKQYRKLFAEVEERKRKRRKAQRQILLALEGLEDD